jgi:hypothetical protein
MGWTSGGIGVKFQVEAKKIFRFSTASTPAVILHSENKELFS